MAISDNQPISAGNLKAALDGLTGGPLLSYKVLLRNDTDTDGGKTYQLADTVENYDMLFVAWGRVDSPAYNNSYNRSTAIVYHNGMKEAWRHNTGTSSSNDAYYSINGATWEGRGYMPDPPRLIIGFKL